MARNIFKGLDKLIEGYHTEEGRRKPKKQIKEVKTRTEIKLGDKVYPIKDKEFLKGKVAGYGNEHGLEHVKTIKYSDGTSYKIYDSGFGNFGHADSCAVLDEKLKGDVPPKGYEKPTSIKGDWIWDEVRYDWYDRDTGSYYAEVKDTISEDINEEDNSNLTSYWAIIKNRSFFDEFESEKKALEYLDVLVEENPNDSFRLFKIKRDEDGNIIGRREEVILIDSSAEDLWPETPMMSQEETADAFGKDVYDLATKKMIKFSDLAEDYHKDSFGQSNWYKNVDDVMSKIMKIEGKPVVNYIYFLGEKVTDEKIKAPTEVKVDQRFTQWISTNTPYRSISAYAKYVGYFTGYETNDGTIYVNGNGDELRKNSEYVSFGGDILSFKDVVEYFPEEDDLDEALHGRDEIDEFFSLCAKLGLKTLGDLQNFADTNRNRIIVNDLLKDYDSTMSADAFFETLRDRVKEMPNDEFKYDDPLNVIKNKDRKNESLDNNTKNSIEVEVKSGINGDGFKVTVKDTDGSIIEQDDFSYGYNASYDKSWADKDKLFVTDIINSYLSKYNLSKDDLILTKGKNVFRDKDVSDETIVRFKTDYLGESLTEKQEDFLSEAISSKDISEYCDTPYQEDTLKLINRIAKREGVSLRIGTKVGKYPQSLIIDHGYQDNAIRIYPNGACSINDKKFGDWQLGYGHINIEEFKKGITSAIKEMSPIKENKSFDDDSEKAWAYEVYRVSDGEVLATGGRKRSYEIAEKYAEETAQAYEEQGYGECSYDVFEDTDPTPMWNRKRTMYESKKLTEGHEQYDYKGFSIDLDDDQFHNIKRHGSGNIAVEIKIGDEVYATVNGYDAAEEWIDKNGQKILDEIEEEKKRKEAEELKRNEKEKLLIDMLNRVNSKNDFYDFRKDSDPGISKAVHLDKEHLGKLLRLGSAGNYKGAIPVDTGIEGIDLFANIYDAGVLGYDLEYGVGAFGDLDSLDKAFNNDAYVFIFRNMTFDNREAADKELTELINNADTVAKDLIDEEWKDSGFKNYDSIFESFKQECGELVSKDMSAAEALVQEDSIKIKDLSSVKEIQKDDEQTWADKEYQELMKKGKPNWDESDWETYHYIQQLRFDSGYYSEGLKEEYGPYQDNEIIRAIGDQIADGNDYGSAYGREWELTIQAEGGEVIENENISSDLYSRLLVDISYPVLDGHLDYYGLNIILWGVPATKEELEFLGFTDEEIERYLKAEDFEEEIETWIDYEITYDGPDIKDELYADEDFDDDTLDESKTVQKLN